MDSTTTQTDFLIVGGGAAGMRAALQASKYGKVKLVTKSNLETSSSYWAQGGIAAVMNDEDSFQFHQKDTLDAGRAFCDAQAVEVLVKEGAEEVQKLIAEGMPFDRTDGKIDLGLEGGHSRRRVLHANGAATGQALIEFLISRVKDEANIGILENAFVYELIKREQRCCGAHVFLHNSQILTTIQSSITVLATGGYSGLYQRSTNPHTSTGDGLWVGYNLGAKLRDMEFIQFHPTAFYTGNGSTFLISEAVRGEGARLYNEYGDRFMEKYEQKELAPRDVVSKEILGQIQQQDQKFVRLDVQHLDLQELRAHFPGLLKRIEDHGIDFKHEGIPVAPAAHYCIGGIATDLHAQTSVKGLYAAGEVAATGVHGANRLASNSILECLVFGKRAIEAAVKNDVSRVIEVSSDTDFTIDDDRKDNFIALQQNVAVLMSDYVNIERDQQGLQKALDELENLRKKWGQEREYFALRAYGLLQVAEFITKASLEREESRGVHARTDYPQQNSEQSSSHFVYQKEHQSPLAI